MATISERIKQIGSANSGTWRTAEEEKAARSRIHENQKRRYTGGIKQQQDELAAASKEVEDEDRAAAMKRKQQQDSEVNALLEAQQKSEAQKSAPGLLLGKAKQKQEPKSKGLPGFLAVKKRGDDCTAAAPSAEANVEDAQASTENIASNRGIGLGAYGSSSEEEEEEEEEEQDEA
mmetsp:Transcript_62815/g.146246  ORF Transcript_62815/g.146246 Transcript_62815/m.146246 type:complete len:176 (-) Transcript_62815:26-553(-)